MSQEQFLMKAVRAANMFLAVAGCGFVLIFLYLVYRHGWTGRVLYLAIPVAAASLLFAALKLSPAIKINIVLFCLSLGVAIYAAEAYLYFLNPMPYERMKPITAVNGAPEWKKQRAKDFARRFGVDFDTRDILEVVAEFRGRGVDAVPFVSPSNNLFIKTKDGSTRVAVNIGGGNIVPLSGIANKATVLCNESGEYVTYPSDMYGFNNPAGIWKSGNMDIVALGDSFTQGYCVPPDKNFVAAIRNHYPATLNLGIAGDGPLLMLATLKEYVTPLKPRTVFWFYFEGNDLHDLAVHRKIKPLARYVEHDFIQGLRRRQNEIDRALLDFLKQADEKRRPNVGGDYPPYDRYLMEFLKLSGLRERTGLIASVDRDRIEAVSASNLELFRQVLAEAKNQVDAWNGDLYFVYLPDWGRYAQTPNTLVQQEAKIVDYVKELGISLIDVRPAFQAHEDPLSLYPFREPSHYNEEGHRMVADEVLKVLGGAEAAGGVKARPSIGRVASADSTMRDR